MRSNELGEILRARRSVVSPRSVGLSPPPFRRSAGLTRGDVAELAGISESYYSRIEQGHCIPSDVTMDAIANVLRLQAGDRAALFQIVDQQEREVGEHGRARLADTSPNEDGAWLRLAADGTVVGWNWLAEVLFANLPQMSARQRYLPAIVSGRRGHLQRHVEVESVVRNLAEGLYRLSLLPQGRDIRTLVGGLLIEIPRFACEWERSARTDVVDQDPLRFRHPDIGDLTLVGMVEYDTATRLVELSYMPDGPSASDAVALLSIVG